MLKLQDWLPHKSGLAVAHAAHAVDTMKCAGSVASSGY